MCVCAEISLASGHQLPNKEVATVVFLRDYALGLFCLFVCFLSFLSFFFLSFFFFVVVVVSLFLFCLIYWFGFYLLFVVVLFVCLREYLLLPLY